MIRRRGRGVDIEGEPGDDDGSSGNGGDEY